MSKKKIIFRSLLHSLLLVAYVFGVSLLMSSGERIFGNKPDNVFGPLAFLMLFVLSATIVGALVLGRPILMYVNGAKREALFFFFATVGWMAFLTLLVFILNF